MAKRFIDTGLFDDEWFADLNNQSKVFWIYYITKCDHAGFLKYNEKLIKFQTGITNLETVIKDFTNRIIRVSEVLLFSPKFIHYQYPNFPNCNFNAANSAKELMIKNNIDPNNYSTVDQLLTNSYSNGNSNSKGNGKGNGNSNGNRLEGLIFPFDTENFKTVWGILIDQKKWKKKGPSALQASLKQLSEYDEQTAIKMMEQSIAGEYQGLFELKNNNNADTKGRKTGIDKDVLNAKFAERFGNKGQGSGDEQLKAV